VICIVLIGLVTVAACDATVAPGRPTPSPIAISATSPAPDPGIIDVQATMGPAVDPESDGPALEGNDPECEVLIGTGDIAGVSGRNDWSLTSDDDDMPDTDIACQWDRGELYTYGWQHLDVNVWSGDTAARFLEGGLPGEPEGVGDGAAWDSIGTRLLVRVGDRVLGIDPGEYLGDTEGREAALRLAAMAVAVLPR
jgi:hypothetical protein